MIKTEASNTDTEPTAARMIELHDAHIESIVIEQGKRARLVFAHIVAFAKKGPDLYDVLSCRTSLELTDLEEMLLDGGLSPREYVSDGKFYDAAGEEVDAARILRSSTARRLDVTFGSGASFSCRFGSAMFEPLIRQRVLEEWSGPLGGTGTSTGGPC
jgi:hypothetical protein